MSGALTDSQWILPEHTSDPVKDESRCPVTAYPARHLGDLQGSGPEQMQKDCCAGEGPGLPAGGGGWNGLGCSLVGTEPVGGAGRMCSARLPRHLCTLGLAQMGAWAQPESPEDRALVSGGAGGEGSACRTKPLAGRDRRPLCGPLSQSPSPVGPCLFRSEMGVTILGCRPHRVVMRLRAGKDCAELSALLHPEGGGQEPR